MRKWIILILVMLCVTLNVEAAQKHHRSSHSKSKVVAKAKKPSHKPKKKKRQKINFLPPANAEARVYPVRELGGLELSDIFVAYVGVEGAIPAGSTIKVHFPTNLKAMWDRKVRRSGNNPVVAALAKRVVDEYTERYNKGQLSHMTLDEYETTVGRIIDPAMKEVDWEKVGSLEGLTSEQLRVLRAATSRLKYRDFLAYEMTELMPTTDGEVNLRVFEFILRNGGREYVESIPAMFDPKTSFGPYQFTEYALYGVPGKLRGASCINSAFGSCALPHGSVAMLRGDQHHIAALQFAIKNLSLMVKGLNSKQLRTFERAIPSRHTDIVTYIAAAHHLPAPARSAAERWLTNGVRSSYKASCNRALTIYAKKTIANLKALRDE